MLRVILLRAALSSSSPALSGRCCLSSLSPNSHLGSGGYGLLLGCVGMGRRRAPSFCRGLAVFFGARWEWQRHEAEIATQRQIAATTLLRQTAQACIATIYWGSVVDAQSDGTKGPTEADVNRAYEAMLHAVSDSKWKDLVNIKPQGAGLVRIGNYCHAAGYDQYRWPEPR